MKENERKISLECIEQKASDKLLNLTGRKLEVFKTDLGICVHYKSCEVLKGPVLCGEYGIGETFEMACDDYLNKIAGQTLVFDSYTEYRKEVRVVVL